jgi:HNH endonuclease
MPDYRGYAVFTRNHSQYLARAAEIHATTPGKGITFRSQQEWTTAYRAVQALGGIPAYFSVIDGEGMVEYEAKLVRVLVDPKPADPATKLLLEDCLEETSGEGLWEEYGQTLKTLYVVKACRKLQRPFLMTSLIKVGDDQPIHPDYSYSYSIVYDRMWQSMDGSSDFLPDEEMFEEAYPEGNRQRVYVNRVERNSKARARCIDKHGAICKVCGFDFEQAYGEIGHGFIHVHHKTPLEQIIEAYEVDPVVDLVPVCPNCHAMLHRGKGEAMSVKELRSIIVSRG